MLKIQGIIEKDLLNGYIQGARLRRAPPTQQRNQTRKEILSMSLPKSALFSEACKLPPIERAELIENLLESFDATRRKGVDAAWAAEAESRIDAYNAGQLDEIPISRVFEEIERGGEYK